VGAGEVERRKALRRRQRMHPATQQVCIRQCRTVAGGVYKSAKHHRQSLWPVWFVRIEPAAAYKQAQNELLLQAD
jgi:hypothetical protein